MWVVNTIFDIQTFLEQVGFRLVFVGRMLELVFAEFTDELADDECGESSCFLSMLASVASFLLAGLDEDDVVGES